MTSASRSRPTRGVRNNNPGNIRHNRSIRWQGMAPSQDAEFVTFISPEMGVRALVRTLLTYHKQHGLRSIQGIINRWAPPVGDRNGPAPGGQYRQNTDAYVNAVCREVAEAIGRPVSPGRALDIDSVEVMRPLVVAIIAHENAGFRYPAHVIDEGLRLAGIANARPQPVMAAGEVKGALISGGAVAGASGLTVLDTFNDVRTQLEPMAYLSNAVAILLVLITLAGVGWTVWSRFDRQRKGLG